jgi:hypothetical protein
LWSPQPLGARLLCFNSHRRVEARLTRENGAVSKPQPHYYIIFIRHLSPFPRRHLPSPAASGNILLLLPSPIMSQRITVIQDKYSPGHTFAEGVAATAATAIGAAVGLRVGFGILTSDMSPAKQAVEKGSNKLRLGVGKLRTAVRMTTSGGPESFWKSTFAAVLSEDEQLLSVYGADSARQPCNSSPTRTTVRLDARRGFYIRPSRRQDVCAYTLLPALLQLYDGGFSTAWCRQRSPRGAHFFKQITFSPGEILVHGLRQLRQGSQCSDFSSM